MAENVKNLRAVHTPRMRQVPESMSGFDKSMLFLQPLFTSGKCKPDVNLESMGDLPLITMAQE